MTARGRSYAGVAMVVVGVSLMVLAMLTAKVENRVASFPAAPLWCGIGLAVGGVGMIFWAFAAAVRQIRESEARLEARLRSEAAAQREQKRPT